ncbi:MAG: glycosyltransferase family A protein [Verrucomicrobiota bacterium]
MHTHPKLSIIVPANNAEIFIGYTISSIRAQRFKDWECILVDDGSTDATSLEAQRAVGDDRRFRLIRQSCGGASKARNRGFLESNPATRYISFMDADDVWMPDALSTLVGRLDENSKTVGAHGLAELIDKNGRPIKEGDFSAFGRRRLGYSEGRIIEWPLSSPTVFETLVWTGPVYPPGLLVARREVYERVGLYDPRLKHCEDWDMCLRLSRMGPIDFVNEVLLHYRRHDSNVSLDVRSARKSVRRLHHKTFFSSDNSLQQRAMLRAGWKAWQVFKLREKCRDAAAACLKGSVWPVFRTAMELPVHLLRYARGYPTPSGI